MAEKSCELVEGLKSVPDPRRPGANLEHRLDEILLIGFCATLANCDDFAEIARWAELHESFFRTFLELPHGIPSHDTFNRVFSLIPPDTLQNVLVPWLLQRRGHTGEFVPIDGKSLRRTRHPSAGKNALHVVSAWAAASGLTLGQVAVDDKSNEITAIPELLELLDLRDKVVTIDAMGCQKEIAADVVRGEGDYVLAVKDNQPTLHAEIRAAFEQTPATAGRTHEEEEIDHGRVEWRQVRVLPAAGRVSQVGLWAGLATLVMVTRISTCLSTGVTSDEVRYFISSLKPDARRLGRAIRSHWMIESMHWVLDVVFHEDARRVYDATVAQNVALMNRLALSVLKGDSSKDSLKVKRKLAGWDIAYLAKLLGFPLD